MLVIFFSTVIFLSIKLPYTAHRITDFSPESVTGIGGRLAMADESSEPIMKRPLIGYGFSQVQNYFPNISKLIISGNPHSGLLSVMLAYGLVGLSIFLWLFLTGIRTAWMLYINLEDGFLKQLMLWITLHLSASLVVFFISAEIEKQIITYLEMGVITSVYAMFVKERVPYCLGNSSQSFFQRTTNSEAITLQSGRAV
jgi:O-antigen ligase